MKINRTKYQTNDLALAVESYVVSIVSSYKESRNIGFMLTITMKACLGTKKKAREIYNSSNFPRFPSGKSGALHDAWTRQTLDVRQLLLKAIVASY